MATSINVEPEVPRTAGRQKHGANAGETKDIKQYYKINYVHMFLDHVIKHLNNRLKKSLISALRGTFAHYRIYKFTNTGN